MPAESNTPQYAPPTKSESSRPNVPRHDGGVDSKEQLPLDLVFDLLRVERRRRVLQYLVTEAGQVTLGELSDHVAGLEYDKPEAAVTSKERKRVYVGLYQSHLPRMDDADVIEFDADRKTVDVGPNAAQLLPYLELESGVGGRAAGGRNWAPYYLVTSVVGGLLLLAQSLLFPIAWLSSVLLDGLLLTLFGLSLAHACDDGVRWLDALCR